MKLLFIKTNTVHAILIKKGVSYSFWASENPQALTSGYYISFNK